jgi:flavorubredoxin
MALHHALSCIEKLDIAMIAPQHGSIFHTPKTVEIILKRLKELRNVGIDSIIGEDAQ